MKEFLESITLVNWVIIMIGISVSIIGAILIKLNGDFKESALKYWGPNPKKGWRHSLARFIHLRIVMGLLYNRHPDAVTHDQKEYFLKGKDEGFRERVDLAFKQKDREIHHLNKVLERKNRKIKAYRAAIHGHSSTKPKRNSND